MEILKELKFSAIHIALLDKNQKPDSISQYSAKTAQYSAKTVEYISHFIKKQALYLNVKRAYLLKMLRVLKKRSGKRLKYIYNQLLLIKYRLSMLSSLLTTLLLATNSVLALNLIALFGLPYCSVLLGVLFWFICNCLAYLLSRHTSLFLKLWDRIQGYRSTLLGYLLSRFKGQIWGLVYRSITVLIVGPIIFLLGGDLASCNEENNDDTDLSFLTDIKFSRDAQAMEDITIDTEEALQGGVVSKLGNLPTIKPESKVDLKFFGTYTLDQCQSDCESSDETPMGDIPLIGVDSAAIQSSNPDIINKLAEVFAKPRAAMDDLAANTSLPLEESFREMSFDHEIAAHLQATQDMAFSSQLDQDLLGGLNLAGPSNREDLSPFPGIPMGHQLVASNTPTPGKEYLRRLKTFEDIMEIRGHQNILTPEMKLRAHAYSAELCYRLVKKNQTFKEEKGNFFKPWQWNQSEVDNRSSLFYWSIYQKAWDFRAKTKGQTISKKDYLEDKWFYTFFQRAYRLKKMKNPDFSIPFLEEELLKLRNDPTQAQINLVFRRFVDYTDINIATGKRFSSRGHFAEFLTYHRLNITRLMQHSFLDKSLTSKRSSKWDYCKKEVPFGYANDPTAPFPRLHEAAMYILTGNFSSESPSQFCKKMYPHFVNLLLEGFRFLKSEPRHSSLHSTAEIFNWNWWKAYPGTAAGPREPGE